MLDFEIDGSVPKQMTPELTFLKGGVGLWQYKIPFFTTNVSLKYAADYFKLFEDLAQADTGEWTLEELFQRDITWTRVEGDILQYLNNQSRPQFFNALTIALLPSNLAEFGAEHGEEIKLPSMPGANLGAPIGVGGVQVQYYGSDVDVKVGAGKLRWSISDVDAVAVDGQHRLAAIKQFVRQNKPAVWQDAYVPVIFVVTDPRLGFATPHAVDEGMRSVGALRALFIDLNKNARPVSATRNILLDDLDVVSVATRAVIGRSLSETVGDERVPLALVDWLTDRNKIEEGPFATTVMLLREAISRLLDVPDPQLDIEDNSVVKVGSWLDRTLPSANPAERQLTMQQVETCAMQQTKLTWLPQNVDALKASFEREWRPHFFNLFRNIRPYSDLWSYADAKSLLTPTFVNLYVAKEVMEGSAARERVERLTDAAKRDVPGWTIEKQYQRPLKHIESTFKAGKWAFKVVFQRAMLRAFVDMLKQPQLYLGDGASREDAADAFVLAMNALFASDLGTVEHEPAKMGYFWAGSGLTAEGAIEFTNAGAERLRAWLLAWVVMRNLTTPIPTHANLEDGEGPQFDFLRRLFDGTTSSVVYKGMVKLATARALAFEDPEVVLKLVRQRYDHMRKLAQA